MSTLIEDLKVEADKYCRANAKEIQPHNFQQHIEKAMQLGAALVIKDQGKRSLDALCGMGPADGETNGE